LPAIYNRANNPEKMQNRRKSMFKVQIQLPFLAARLLRDSRCKEKSGSARRTCFAVSVLLMAAAGLAAELPATRQGPDLAKGREFWAFQPVRAGALPKLLDQAWLRTPVDRFVLAKLEEKGLRPAAEATKEELIRRVCFDLTGLPPAPQEIQAFVTDSSADAYEKLVDQLLASPHFGEKWAVHWLDVVRFAESEGFEYDRHLPQAWRYRDYVVRAFNSDKPFDQFVAEQIAGDEMSPGDPECETAAVFHRLGPVRRNAGNPEFVLSRNEVLTERTDVIGAAFLGLTIGCARCHDHKFDPISQKDYYRLQAYLASTQEHDIVLASPEEQEARKRETLAINDRIKELKESAKHATREERTKITEEIEAIEEQLPPLETIPGIRDDFAHRTEIHVLKRGEWEKKGDLVAPRPLSVLTADDVPELSADAPKPRTALAHWLTDPRNPLTPRAIVNRIWQGHFGLGIVKTANNFGINGDRPSHPELLDFLASQLVAGGWKLKPLHRMILLSSAYRQSSRSAIEEQGLRADPEDRLLWRFARRRLSAEEIRDAMLAASGQINLTVGGPSVMLPVDPELMQQLLKPAQWQPSSNPAEQHRRSIYLIAKRNLRLPFMEVFDQPALTTSCGRRESSTHAPQALEMLNGQLANEMATALAARLTRECGSDRGRIVERAYWLTLGRAPTAREREIARAYLLDQPLKEFALACFNLNGFLYVQ
jgi:hypothetical protein